MLSYKRSTRVAELIQQEVSKIVQELKEPGLGFVTITGVKLTDDLQDARVFYSVIGSQEEIDRTRIILRNAIPRIRHELAGRINMRRTPTLVFDFDETPARASRIFDILEKIKTEEETRTEPPATEEPKKKRTTKPKKG